MYSPLISQTVADVNAQRFFPDAGCMHKRANWKYVSMSMSIYEGLSDGSAPKGVSSEPSGATPVKRPVGRPRKRPSNVEPGRFTFIQLLLSPNGNSKLRCSKTIVPFSSTQNMAVAARSPLTGV